MHLKIILIIIIIFLIGWILSIELKKYKLVEGTGKVRKFATKRVKGKMRGNVKNTAISSIPDGALISEWKKCPDCIESIYKTATQAVEGMEFGPVIDGFITAWDGYGVYEECKDCENTISSLKNCYESEIKKIDSKPGHHKSTMKDAQTAICNCVPADLPFCQYPASMENRPIHSWAEVGMEPQKEGPGPDYYYNAGFRATADNYFESRHPQCGINKCKQCLRYSNNFKQYNCSEDSATAVECNSAPPVSSEGGKMDNIWCGSGRPESCDKSECDGGCLYNTGGGEMKCATDIGEERCNNNNDYLKDPIWCNSTKKQGMYDKGNYKQTFSNKDCKEHKCKECLFGHSKKNKIQHIGCKPIEKYKCKGSGKIQAFWCGESGDDSS